MHKQENRAARAATALRLIALTILTAAGCADVAKEYSEQTLVRAIDSDPTSLVPNLMFDTGSVEIARDTYEGLTTTSETGDITLGSAARVSVDREGTRYTFEIREDARWSNGDPLLASDFVRGIKFAVDPENGARQANILAPLRNYEAVRSSALPIEALGVVAIDERTLQIDLEYAAPHIFSILEYPLCYPMHARALNADYKSSFPPSNGAYKITSYLFANDVQIEKNEFYHGEASVKIESVRYILSQDQAAIFRRFRSQEVHLTASVPTNQVETARSLQDGRYIQSPQLAVYYYAFNTSKPPLDDIRIRKALNISVDRTSLVRDVLASGQTEAISPVPNFMPGFTEFRRPRDAFGSQQSIQEANALLEAAGYNTANKLEIELLYNTGSDHSRIAQYVTHTWQSQLPVKVSQKNLEFRVLLDTHNDRSSWDVIRSSWTADFADPINFLSIFETHSPNNISGISDESYDAMLLDAQSTLDQDRRYEKLFDAESQLMTHHANLFLYYYSDRRMVSTELSEFTPNPMGIIKSQFLSWQKAN